MGGGNDRSDDSNCSKLTQGNYQGWAIEEPRLSLKLENNTDVLPERLTVNPLVIRNLLSELDPGRMDLKSALANCGLEVSDVFESTKRIPVSAAVRLLQVCRVASGDEFLGLLARPIPKGYFRHSVLSCLHQRTLGHALKRYIDFGNTFFNSLSFDLLIKDGLAKFIIRRLPSGSVKNNVAIDTALAVMHRQAGWICDQHIIINRVRLDYPAPEYAAEYRYLFYGAGVDFAQDEISLGFEQKYLDLPIVQTEAGAERFVRRAPLDIYLRQDVYGETSRMIREKIKLSITNEPTMTALQEIADQLKISSQTLRRRLAAEGTSFNQLKSQVRRDIAMNALGDTSLSIELVAELTGYSEPAAFIKAFKIWTDMTPARFRKLIAMEENLID